MTFSEFLVLNLNFCAYVLTSVVLQESWEDEEEEKKDEEKVEAPAPPAKPKKRIQDKIAEKEVSLVSPTNICVQELKHSSFQRAESYLIQGVQVCPALNRKLSLLVIVKNKYLLGFRY